MPRADSRSPLLIALAVGLIAGLGYPVVDLAISCRDPVSEACGWGKAYLPLTFGLSVVLLGGPVTGVVYAVLRARRRRPPGDDR